MMKRANHLLTVTADWIRKVLLALATNEMLFFFAAFLRPAFVDTELFLWHPEEAEMYNSMIIVPWGMALCLYRLGCRSQIQSKAPRTDVAALFVLLVWIVVPSCIRFGLTQANTVCWLGSATVYFVLYAMTTEESLKKREALFDQICAMFCVLSLLLGGALLWCAWTGARIDGDWVVHYGTYAGIGPSFGVYDLSHLCHGEHYNNTGMLALCCTMFCLAGAARRKNILLRMPHLIAAVMMMIVVVLTQSRTARYSLIIALGVGVYGYLASMRKIRYMFLRHVAGILAAAVVMVVSYVGAAKLTDAALVHYAECDQKFRAAMMQGTEAPVEEASIQGAWVPIAKALAEEEPIQETVQIEVPTVEPKQARAAMNSNFTGRTIIWGGLVEYWKQHPKYFIIGAGADKVGYSVAESLGWRIYAMSMHNAYLQHVADHGLIGMVLLVVFFLIVLVPVLRVFFASGEKRKPGYNAMCMLVVGTLITGLMENQPLVPMTHMNMSLFVALAFLCAAGRDMKEVK